MVKVAWIFLFALMGLMVLLASSCGDDDDDSSGGSSGYSCSEACQMFYDNCSDELSTLPVPFSSQSECTSGCEDQGGIDSCESDCIDQFKSDKDCTAVFTCIYGCAK